MSKSAGFIAALPLALGLPMSGGDFPRTNQWIDEFATAAQGMVEPEKIIESLDWNALQQRYADDPQYRSEIQSIIDQMGQ